MHGNYSNTFFSKWYILYVLCGVLLIMVGVLWEGFAGNSIHAASFSIDMPVVIAVDVTPSSCRITRTLLSHRTHKILSTVRSRCPAGTVVVTKNVPLSQAKAKHEAYTVYPPAHASPNIWMNWNEQVNHLIDAERAALQHPQRPDSCTDGGDDQVSDVFTPVQGNQLDVTTYYHVSSICTNVIFQHMEVDGWPPANGSLYWVDNRYSRAVWGCEIAPNWVPDHDLNYYPISGKPNSLTQPYGLYDVFDFYEGNLCVYDQGLIHSSVSEILI